MGLFVRMIDGMSNVTVDDELSFQTNFLNDEGIVNHSGTDLQVQAQTVPDLTVKVKAGTCYVKRDAWTATSGTLKFWEAVLDADANVTIPANSSGGTIRRIVCMKIDTGVSPDANASNVASLVVVSGVSGGGDPTIPDNHLPLARVTHTNADTSIASGDITDLRTVAGLKSDKVSAATTNGDLILSGNGTGTVRKPLSVSIQVVGGTTDLSTGDGKFYFTIPPELNGMVLSAVHARVVTAGTTNTTDIQLHNVTDAVDILSTKLTIDSGETGSDTAATAAVINTSNDDMATNDLIRIDIDQVSTTAPKGLIVRLTFGF